MPFSISSSLAKLSLYLRSALFFVAIVLITLTVSPIMVLKRNAPFSTRYGLARCWARLALGALEKICGLHYQLEGLEQLPARNGVILCKHQSAWETFALQALFPPMTFVLKQELLKIPLWGASMATCDPIAINRGAKTVALKQLLRQGQERLNQGRWVVLFPEGTRVAPGSRVKYAASGGMLAERTGCPVVPVAHNAGEFWARNGFFIYPGTIKMHIGPAIDATQHTAQEIVDIAEEWIEKRVAEISRSAPMA